MELPANVQQFIQGADYLASQAGQHLPPEGVDEFNLAVAVLHKVAAKCPKWAQQFEAGSAMEQDTAEPDEIEAANAAADEAIKKAAEGANKDSVGRQAYHCTLEQAKKQRIISKFTKKKEQG